MMERKGGENQKKGEKREIYILRTFFWGLATGQVIVLKRDVMKFYVPRTQFPFINKLSPNKILYGSFRTARIATRGCNAHLALGLGATTRGNYVMRS
jgi:hypothetical protein